MNNNVGHCFCEKLTEANNRESVLKYANVEDSYNYLKSRISYHPTIGIICGTGLGPLADTLEDKDVFDYDEIPHFPTTTIKGHAGKLVFGKLSGKSIVCMQGRVHGYEGVPLWKSTFPVRVMKLFGVKILIVTNASGCLNDNYNVGDVMIIKDHINLPGLSGTNPLVGLSDTKFGLRFVSMADAYNSELRSMARKVAKELSMDYVKEGVYLVQIGPHFETVAECRMAKMFGADVVGMSTAPEVIVARQCGIRCLGLSLVTNLCTLEYDTAEYFSHEDVIGEGQKRAKDLQEYVTRIVEQM